jgi:hypothetical protein
LGASAAPPKIKAPAGSQCLPRHSR